MRAATLSLSALLLTAVVCGSALAQNPAQAPAQPTPQQAQQPSGEEQQGEGRLNQRIERLTVEDGGSRIDELRVGGQTQSITVKPKSAGGGIPAYQVIPNNGVRDGGPSRAGAETMTAPRVWTLGNF